MKKFIIKNKKKRKYVRKTDIKETSFSNATSIGLLPILLVGIAVLMIAFISTQAVDDFVAGISFHVPTITLPQVTLPAISIPPIQFNNWNVNLKPFVTVPLNAGIALQQFFTQTIASINLLPFFQAVGIGIQSVVLYIYNDIAQSLTNYVVAQANGFQLIFIGLQTLWQMIIIGGINAGEAVQSFAATLGSAVINLTIATWKLIIFLFQSIVDGIQIVFVAIVTFIGMVMHAISVFFNGLIYYITLPFKMLWHYILETRPFFIAFGKLIQQSCNELVAGFKALGEIVQMTQTK